MSNKLIFAVALFYSGLGLADTYTSTTTQESLRTDTKKACSSVSRKDAEDQCNKWLDEQKKSLGNLIRTSTCEPGTQITDPALVGDCLYLSVGSVNYILKTEKKETERYGR